MAQCLLDDRVRRMHAQLGADQRERRAARHVAEADAAAEAARRDGRLVGAGVIYYPASLVAA